MFVRVKTTPNSPRKSVQLVESVRKDGTVKQRIVRHVGVAMDEQEVQQLQALAEQIKAKLEDHVQPGLFRPEDMAQLARRADGSKDPTAPLRVDLKQLREEQRVIVGVHEIYGKLYQELGFEKSLKNPKRQKASARNLFHVVMARIANPRSKRGSVEELEKRFGVELSLPSVYRMLDALDPEAIRRINRLAYEAAEGLWNDKARVVFYDCTTLYFESFSQDELKRNGWSKDGKFNQPQVVLALMVNSAGLPMGYEVYAGSTFEGHTLMDALTRLEQDYGLKEAVVVADSAMLGEHNQKQLEKEGRHYILGARLKNLPLSWQKKAQEVGQEKAVEPKEERLREYEYESGRRLIVSWSAQRARKDAHDREQSLESLKKKLQRSANPERLISRFGYQRFLKVEGESKVAIDEQKVLEAARWDGLHGVITNLKDLTRSEITEQYHGLWQIEDCFRISKHDLSIRPIFLWTPEHVRAHVAICFIALVCVRHLMNRARLQYQRLSAEAIRQHLIQVQVSILKDQIKGTRFVLPSNHTQEARKLYQMMGLKLSPVPYQISL